jgi:A/G-specific adenine glycosylase
MTTPFTAPVLRWYAHSARDLPWRQPAATPWSILVSEIMLQQTPVSRVLPAYDAWIRRWPEPAALAAATAADAVRQWDRLGYPRRAIRLHASAELITTRHDGQVPASADELRRLPGVGPYTAAAVASFAFGQRHAVLDTNVRRVLTRLVAGHFLPPQAPRAAEIRLAESLLPLDGRAAARWSVGVMELGALVCTAARPRCDDCPVRDQCSWFRQGKSTGPVRRSSPRYEGSDRQSRGRLLAVLRSASGPLSPDALAAAWPDAAQRTRALAALIDDGLVVRCSDGSLALPGESSVADASALRTH